MSSKRETDEHPIAKDLLEHTTLCDLLADEGDEGRNGHRQDLEKFLLNIPGSFLKAERANIREKYGDTDAILALNKVLSDVWVRQLLLAHVGLDELLAGKGDEGRGGHRQYLVKHLFTISGSSLKTLESGLENIRGECGNTDSVLELSETLSDARLRRLLAGVE